MNDDILIDGALKFPSPPSIPMVIIRREKYERLMDISRAAAEFAEAWDNMHTGWKTRGFSGQSAMIDRVNEAYDKLQAALDTKYTDG